MKNMPTLTLKRTYTNDGYGPTIGILYSDYNAKICEILERPRFYKSLKNAKDDKKTKINESCCIPEGVYKVKMTYSPAFKKELYLLLDVKNRDGIRIHSANKIQQLLGCLAPCLKVIMKNGEHWADESRRGLEALYNHTQKKEFDLIIKSNI